MKTITKNYKVGDKFEITSVDKTVTWVTGTIVELDEFSDHFAYMDDFGDEIEVTQDMPGMFTEKIVSIIKIGNNGNELIDVLGRRGLIIAGMDAEQIAEIAKPYMYNERHLENDDFWEDVFYRAEELGYKLKY